MKKALKIIYTVSILIFLILWVLSKFTEHEINTMENRNLFIIIHLVSSLKYYKMELDDKNIEINILKEKLKNDFKKNKEI